MATQPDRKRQFHTAVGRRTFFDRKVLPYGYSRTVALGKAIPKGWHYVRIYIMELSDKHVTLRIEKLLGDAPNACVTKSNPRGKRHT